MLIDRLMYNETSICIFTNKRTVCMMIEHPLPILLIVDKISWNGSSSRPEEDHILQYASFSYDSPKKIKGMHGNSNTA